MAPMKQLYPTLLLALLAGPLAAQTLTNNGGILTVQQGATLYIPGALDNKASSTLTNAGTLWVAGNLTNAGTVASSGLVLLSGTTAQTLTPGGASVAQLEVNNTSAQGVSVPTDLGITQQLKLTAGMVRTAANAIISLTNEASVSGEATGRYVQGNLRVTRTNVTSATNFTNSATIGGNGQNLGQVTVTRTAGLATAGTSYGTFGNNKSIDRIWTVTTSMAPTGAVPITLAWLPDNDNGLTDFSRVLIWRQPTATAPWNGAGAAADASTTRSISTTTTSFDRLTISNQSNPLPVELTRFSAERRADDAWLSWATASEKNSAHFDVEVSVDGQKFQKVAEVAGQGTTGQRTNYTYTDSRVARYDAPLLYYRLRQVDTDGTTSYSTVQILTVSTAAQTLAVQPFPNPFGQSLVARIVAPQAGITTLTLTDATGRTLCTQQLALPSGTSDISLPEVASFPTGIYFLAIQQAAARRMVRVVKQ
ncbi:T9SS type A sorting domain-containing protein [Hymenobacter profundi]|uniref:T9SS type A sorting domain-containing protein n=2 Tax=Hymenobacter profundi TaxID=1982110 RepID=A0ABS6WX60_9BACT|nr:T9SS type A sorting domain-containing protein [Hymenobacter profundi]